jgi:alanine racemase
MTFATQAVACTPAFANPKRPTATPMAVDGRLARLVGRVSMDMLTVGLEGHSEAGIGSVAQLWGDLINVNTVARAAGTVSYKLLCNVKRVPWRYVRA